jgi:voltage-gated potassium channel
MKRLGDILHELYERDSPRAHVFRYGLLTFDLLTIAFIIASSFLHWEGTEWIDIGIGVLLLADFCARLWLAKNRRKHLISPLGLIDIVTVASFLAPLAGEGFGFLRILRLLSIGHNYLIMRRIKRDFPVLRRNEAAFVAAINLVVCMFLATALVYETQKAINPKILHYGDAFYFTVTAMSTTGFGDITLEGPWGRALSIAIMLCGVTLFFRLVQAMLRPAKVEHKCPTCGLLRHDFDAVCCKACGEVLNIEDEGAV